MLGAGVVGSLVIFWGGLVVLLVFRSLKQWYGVL